MKPENSSSGGDLSNGTPSTPPTDQGTAANVIRSQIDALYGGGSVAEPQVTPAQVHSRGTQPVQQTPISATEEDINPYNRTHNSSPQPQAEQWKQYHTAWQTYYQKYYEGYYAAQQRQAHTQTQQTATPNQPGEAIGSKSAHHQFFTEPTNSSQSAPYELEKDAALYELRQKLLGKVQHSAKKIRKSKHFIPIAASLIVVLIFVFIQYNRVFIATVNAYISPGAISPQNIVIDPSNDVAVSQDPRLIIPKINVDVPVLYDVGNDYNSQMKAMEQGVAHFAIPGAQSHPGEIGNTVLSGHSSNDLFDTGDYKFIFAQLEKLVVGDTIYANYQGKRYTYVVTKTEVVKPTEVSKLVYPTTKPMLTLITCTPLGTAQNRLLVTAEQVSPDPAQASQAPTTNASAGASMPGSSPTFIERIFGAQ